MEAVHRPVRVRSRMNKTFDCPPLHWMEPRKRNSNRMEDWWSLNCVAARCGTFPLQGIARIDWLRPSCGRLVLPPSSVGFCVRSRRFPKICSDPDWFPISLTNSLWMTREKNWTEQKLCSFDFRDGNLTCRCVSVFDRYHMITFVKIVYCNANVNDEK